MSVPSTAWLKPRMTVRARADRDSLPLVDGTGKIPRHVPLVVIERVDPSDGTVKGTWLDWKGDQIRGGGWMTAAHLEPLPKGKEVSAPSKILSEEDYREIERKEKLAREEAARPPFDPVAHERQWKAKVRGVVNGRHKSEAVRQLAGRSASSKCPGPHDECPKCHHKYCHESHESNFQDWDYYYVICACDCLEWIGDNDQHRKRFGCCRCQGSRFEGDCLYCPVLLTGGKHPTADSADD